jgi:hypothetical protein
MQNMDQFIICDSWQYYRISIVIELEERRNDSQFAVIQGQDV